MQKPKILLLDIETSPDLAYVWGVWDTNAIAIKEHWRILSFSAEWYHTNVKVTVGLDDYGGYTDGDEDLCNDLWELLDAADIVVAHNAAKFDIRKINARFIAWNMTPPSPYKVVDTLREVRRVAAFSSNKLDWLSKQLDLGKKIAHEGFGLWQGCMEDDPDAWKRMKKYNRHDIVLLRKLYDTLAPWSRQPNANLYTGGGKVVCVNPACMSTKIKKDGVAYLKTRSYQRYKCLTCGKPARATTNGKGSGGITEVS